MQRWILIDTEKVLVQQEVQDKMNDPYKYYHESKEVLLKSKSPLLINTLINVLNNLNFKTEDELDVRWVERADKVEKWQDEDIATLEIIKNNQVLRFYEDEEFDDVKNEEWDAIKLKSGFAIIPFAVTEKFLEIISILSKTFDLEIVHDGIVMNENELLDKFKQYKDELTKELDEPGSEFVKIMIQQSYPRTPLGQERCRL
jgi:hypothetical protein